MMNAPETEAGKPRSVEFQDHFAQVIRDAFLMAGDREPIGQVLGFLASEAFENGLGRDEAVRHIVTPEVFGNDGLIIGPLHGCIKHEVDLAYAGKRGRRKLTPQQKKLLRTELAKFLTDMNPHHSVTSFFRNLVHGRTGVGPITTENTASTVSKDSVVRWALGKKTTSMIKGRFRKLVGTVMVAEYRGHIEKKPEQYIANFLNDVLRVSVQNDHETGEVRPQVQFQIGNLKELFRDIHDSVSFERFWKILTAHADTSYEDLKRMVGNARNIHDFFNLELWRSSILAIWEEVNNEGSRKEGQRESVRRHHEEAVETLRQGVRQKVRSVSKVHFIIQPPDPHKMTIEVQSLQGRRLGIAYMKPNIASGPESNIRRYVRRLLAGNDSRLANELRAKGVSLAADGLEVDALVMHLSSLARSSSRLRR